MAILKLRLCSSILRCSYEPIAPQGSPMPKEKCGEPRLGPSVPSPLPEGHGLRAQALVNGDVGVIVAPRGHLFRALRFTFNNGKIAEIDVVADAERLARLDLAVL